MPTNVGASMSILFFDGFDRYSVLKNFDTDYWSYQPGLPLSYEKYAFGGYTYNHGVEDYQSIYSYYSPNNATLPSGTLVGHVINPFGGVYLSGNYYPGFGSPPGFLALSNLDITNPNILEPITYVQLSGFSPPSGSATFLTSRILGVETKDSTVNDIDGRFGAKHPLIAFCSGNTTGLLISIVKVTGDHLFSIENKKMTIGMQIEQNNGISGIFDLNITNDLARYRIRSVYTSTNGYTINEYSGRMLCIDNNTDGHPLSPISRWCHFQFGIIATGDIPYLQVKLDDVDLLSIPSNQLLTDRDLWDDRILISGFNFDNIRFFNRTYNGSIQFPTNAQSYYDSTPYFNYAWSRYYGLGSLTLIDDVILSDDTGATPTFLGMNAKVVPFTPGISQNLNNNGVSSDGFLQWSTNSSSYRKAIKNLDGDTSKIFSSVSGAINAVAYNTYLSNGLLPDGTSSTIWGRIQDGVGGIKIYSQAKKEFLDTKYVPVIRTGVNDIYFGDKTQTILNSQGDTVVDRTRKLQFKELGNVTSSNSITLFDQNSIVFDNSYIYTSSFGNLKPSSPYLSIDAADFFVIESWVYFTGDKPIYLFSKKPPSTFDPPITFARALNFEFVCHTGYIDYNYYVDNVLAQRIRFDFPETMTTGQWYHVAILRDGKASDGITDGYYTYYRHQYPMSVFLNGVSGTAYSIETNLDVNSPSMNGVYSSDSNYGTRYLFYPNFPTVGSNDYDIVADGLSSTISNVVSSYGTLVSSGTYSSPATGSFIGIGVPYNGTQNIVSFKCEYSGILYYQLSATNASATPYLQILKNNVSQINQIDIGGPNYTIRRVARYIPPTDISGTLLVASGDNIIFRGSPDFNNSSNFNLQIKNINITNGKILNGKYHLHNDYPYYYYNLVVYHPFASIANFSDAYGPGTLSDTNVVKNNFPLFIGGNNLISNYRITQGAVSIDNVLRTRFNSNFTVPNSYFLSQDDDYINIGEIQTLTKTRFTKAYQVYEFNNPGNNQPWTTGLIANTGGLIFGVRKL